MRKRILSLLAIVGVAFSAHAQSWVSDSVAMGTGFVNDVFYGMTNNTVKAENNLNWHLAFSMNTGDSSSIWANHNTGNAYVKVYNIHKDKSQWGSVAVSDTLAADLCYNYDNEWSQGALNDIYSPNIFNFGWGTYEPVSHQIVGDSIFIIKTNNTMYKVMIDSLETVSMTYYFRVGDIVGNTTNSYTITKAGKFANTLFAHFNLVSGTDTLREPNKNDWDILFTRYNTLASQGGPAIPYNVVGVLGNNSALFTRAQNVHVDTAFVNYATYTNPWSKMISTIGYNWKSFNGAGYVIPDSNSYFIKDKNGAMFQLQFESYTTTGGVITFRKRVITPTQVGSVESNFNQLAIFPNPAQDNINLVVDAKENTSSKISLMDITGKVVYSVQVEFNSGMNAFLLPTQNLLNGNYLLMIQGKNIQECSKITVIH